MTHYQVRWEIDVEAETPEAAALQAREIQLDHTSRATVFDVFLPDLLTPSGQPVSFAVDLEEEGLCW